MDNIYIPFKDYRHSIGGPSTFMLNLQRFLNSNKFIFYSNSWKIKNTDGIFFPISYNKSVLSYFRSNKLPIIQRLDGIYYPSKHGESYLELNKDIKDIYLNYSTHVIFQSKYCREQCFSMFGNLPEEKYSIIYNGANKDIFYSDKKGRQDDKKEFKLVTTGNFRNVDMLEPLIQALELLNDKYKFNLTIVGPITNNHLKHIIKNKSYILDIKKAGQKTISSILRKSDLFLYSHLNPPCPNSVIEAISCGLPVVGFDSGSMSELLFFGRDLLASVSNKVFQKYNEFNPITLKDKIEYCFVNLASIKKRSLDHSGLYNFKDTGKLYMELFANL